MLLRPKWDQHLFVRRLQADCQLEARLSPIVQLAQKVQGLGSSVPEASQNLLHPKRPDWLFGTHSGNDPLTY